MPFGDLIARLAELASQLPESAATAINRVIEILQGKG